MFRTVRDYRKDPNPGEDYTYFVNVYGKYEVLDEESGEIRNFDPERDNPDRRIKGVSLTVPGQDYSVPELVARFTQDGGFNREIYEPQYLQSDLLAGIARMNKMDLIDLDIKVQRAVDTYEKRQAFEKEEAERIARRNAEDASGIHTNENPNTDRRDP